jgi:hypothetical protein
MLANIVLNANTGLVLRMTHPLVRGSKFPGKNPMLTLQTAILTPRIETRF